MILPGSTLYLAGETMIREKEGTVVRDFLDNQQYFSRGIRIEPGGVTYSLASCDRRGISRAGVRSSPLFFCIYRIYLMKKCDTQYVDIKCRLWLRPEKKNKYQVDAIKKKRFTKRKRGPKIRSHLCLDSMLSGQRKWEDAK